MGNNLLDTCEQGCRDAPACLDGPGRLRSLWEMLRFSAANFLVVISNLDTLRVLHQQRLNNGPVAQHANERLQQEQAAVLVYLHNATSQGLFSTVIFKKTARLAERLQDNQSNPHVCCALIDELKLDMRADLESHVFLAIEGAQAELLNPEALLFGPAVADAFPDANRDIAAAGRCVALEEWTAAVFHLMRVLEHGLCQMAKRFNVPFAQDSWHKVIHGIEAGITELRDKHGLTERDRKEITFYSDAASQFRYFKDAWRNHVSHGREHYDESDAEKVMTHVREFMQQLAKTV